MDDQVYFQSSGGIRLQRAVSKALFPSGDMGSQNERIFFFSLGLELGALYFTIHALVEALSNSSLVYARPVTDVYIQYQELCTQGVQRTIRLT